MIVPHSFTLDDAALSGGAAILAAGSGLPRRITGAIDYEARVLALNPTGYWPLNELSGQYLDRTASARHLTPAAPQPGTRGQSGSGVGGSTTLALSAAGGSPISLAQDAAGDFEGHRFIVGTPFSAACWYLMAPAGAGIPSVGLLGQLNAGARSDLNLVAWEGWGLSSWGANNQMRFVWRLNYQVGVRCRLVYDSGTGARDRRLYDGDWHHVAIVYDGGSVTAAGSFKIYIDGVATPDLSNLDAGVNATTQIKNFGCHGSGVVLGHRMQHVAIWAGAAGVALSAAQIQALASAVPCGSAIWTLPVATYDRTLKGLQLPGRLARADLTRLGVRAYYQIGAGARTEFDPGDDLTATIPAGSACSLEADLTHHDLDDLPWIADASGGGPVVLVEEPDPAPVYVSTPSGALSMNIEDRTAIGLTIQDRTAITMQLQDVTS